MPTNPVAEECFDKLAQLPPEIVGTVCRSADTGVLQALRLSSKLLKSYAEPELFRAVTLRVSKTSRENLANIAIDEHLRHYVHVLTYDIRLLPWNIEDEWVSTVLHRCSEPPFSACEAAGTSFRRCRINLCGHSDSIGW